MTEAVILARRLGDGTSHSAVRSSAKEAAHKARARLRRSEAIASACVIGIGAGYLIALAYAAKLFILWYSAG